MAGKELTISGCCATVRALRSSEEDSQTRSAPVAAVIDPGSSSPKPRSLSCFKCGEVGHIRRNCPQRSGGSGRERQSQQQRPGGSRKRVVCYFCDEEGHTKPDCQQRKNWLAGRQVAAAASGQGKGGTATGDNPCLCTVAGTGKLPRVYVDVVSSGDDEAVRARAVVDTGWARTLIAKPFARENEMAASMTLMPPMIALDGSPVEVLGTVTVTLQRTDGPVILSPIEVDACVVESLAVVDSVILIGNDVISSSGGLHLQYAEDGRLSNVVFGTSVTPGPDVCAAAANPDRHPYPHVRVERIGQDVKLETEDCTVQWDNDSQRWTMNWRWKAGTPPSQPVGCGVGEYSRRSLTEEQEQLFRTEVDAWIDRGWMLPYSKEIHGEPACVLPLLAQVQEHKSSTPVRPCLDYRELNKLLLSQPGRDAPVCENILRKWRAIGDAGEFSVLDIKKAYLQIRVAPELLRYQVVIWKGERYAMTRMGFGMNVAPKIMDVVVQWIVRHFSAVDNYVDDVVTPTSDADAVAKQLAKYGLPTKPVEPMASSRVLGLQLSKTEEGQVMWQRREGIALSLQPQLTKRLLFGWCGRLTGHVPVAG